MKVSEVMTRQVELAKPDETIEQAARLMAKVDTGALPVSEGDRLVGMITDRDIAIRAVAEGKGPDTKVREAMTPEVKYCFEDEDLGHVAKNMGDIRVRRLPVVNRDKRLVGIVSLGDIAVEAGKGPAGQALAGVSRPGGPHAQVDKAAAGGKPGGTSQT
jgi:CBS domain-containing protein